MSILYDTTQMIISLLKRYEPQQIVSDHYSPPHLSRITWKELGNYIVANEHRAVERIYGDKWISLRLDGHNFSKLLKYLKKIGVLSQGYSIEFADIMQTCTKILMNNNHIYIMEECQN
jgi:hypothetical protein